MMNGKTVLVTGASAGIGKETAIALARQGARVIAVCRDPARGERSLAEIRARSGNPSVELKLADLSSQEAIRRLAGELCARGAPLHVLVNNAAAAFRKRRLTVDGIEATFALNHLAYVLLTALLLDLLKSSAPARIVNVSSMAHEAGRINFADLQMANDYGGARAYSNSKLANVVFTYELARRLAGTGVTANCLHPGTVATSIFRDYPWFVRLYTRIAFKRPAEGAATSIYLASSPDLEGISGKYFVDKAPVRSSPTSYDEDLAGRLWTESAVLVGL